MTHYLIFESGRPGNQRSAPIAADDLKSIAVLERDGWRVAEEYDAGESLPASVGDPIDEPASDEEAETLDEAGVEEAAPAPKKKPR